MGQLSFTYKVFIGDIGETNNITNKGFLRLMQEAATSASQSVGYGPNTVSETRLFWVILNWKLKVFSRPRWNENVTIKTWPASMSKCYSSREFELYDDTGNLIAIASSKWVLVSLDTGIMRISKELEDKYEPFNKSLFEKPLEKIKEPETSECTLEYTVQRRDIDTNHHVNNTMYIDYAYEAIPEEVYKNSTFDNVEIMYKHEAKLGDTILCFYTKIESGEHIVTLKNKEDNTLHTIIKLY